MSRNFQKRFLSIIFLITGIHFGIKDKLFDDNYILQVATILNLCFSKLYIVHFESFYWGKKTHTQKQNNTKTQ